jgi:ABC-type cobalamin transport system ATPase subunit
MLLNHRLLGFGPSAEVLKSERLMQAYGNRLRMVDANGNLIALDDTCCGEEEHEH